MNPEDLTLSLYSDIVSGTSTESPEMDEAKKRGFSKKLHDEMFHPHLQNNNPGAFSDTAIGQPQYVGYDRGYSERIVGNPLPDSYFEGMGGAMPTVPSSPAAYLQTQLVSKTAAKDSYKERGYLSEFWNNILIGIYDIIPETYMYLRDRAMIWVNSLGKIPNLLSTLYALAADCGPIRRILTDPCDRLEILLEGHAIRGMRNYNNRKWPQWIIKRAFRDGKVPRQGRPAESEDITFNSEGHLVVGSPDNPVGGYVMRPDEIERIEEFYAGESDNEYWVSLGLSRTKGMDLSEFRRNITRFTLSHYVHNKGKAIVKDLGEYTHPDGRKIKLTRMTLPYGYNPIQWDPSLFKSTIGYTLAYLVANIPYYIGDKILGKLPFKKKGTLIQGRLNRMFIPIIMPEYQVQDIIYH